MSADRERFSTPEEATQETPAKLAEDILISSSLKLPQETQPKEDVVIGEIKYLDCFPKSSTKQSGTETIH